MTHQERETGSSLLRQADLPLEVVILLVGGMALLISGALLFPASAGALPYYANGLYGILLVVFALQMMMLGKTPFGDVRRSRPLLLLGVLTASVGIVTCFVPAPSAVPRVLLVLFLGPGGVLLLLQTIFARDKLGTWVRHGGILRHLAVASCAVYGLSALIAWLLWRESRLTTPWAASAVLASGGAVLYLAAVLQGVYRRYPEAERRPMGDVTLSTDQALLLLTGVFMLLLGGLLVPVSLGLLPFSGSAQLGLLMVIFSVQMLASGSTPIGPFPRSWLVIAFGLLFAALGIVSCIVPMVLVPSLTLLVGVLNILGAVVSLVKMRAFRPRAPGEPNSPSHPVLAKLRAVQLTMNTLQILFGTSMFLPGVVPMLVIGVILAANGCVLLYLLHLLTLVDAMQPAAAEAP